MCCSVLQYVTLYCSALWCVAVCCSVLQCVAVTPTPHTNGHVCSVRCSVLQRVALCCIVLQCVALRCTVLQRVAVCCNMLRVLHCVAVTQRLHCNTLQHTATHSCHVIHNRQVCRICYSVLQYVVVCCNVL